jgi:hypothetical protein
MKKEREKNPAEPFLALSAILSGFESVDLLGTGLVGAYYNEVVNIVGKAICDELWAITTQVIERSGKDEAKLETAIRQEILASPKFGPVARNIIQMWYVGNWNELPQSWRDVYGVSPNDTTRVISSVAYQQGLVWDAIGAHAPAAKQPGFDSWSYPPTTDLL